jgi:hypothetical protein
MKKLLIVTLAVAVLLVLLTVPAFAKAGKAPLYNAPTNFACPAGAQPAAGDPTFGFVVINATGNGKLQVEVSLKGATPNAKYDIWVNQSPGACPLNGPTASAALKTNKQGNGNAHFQVTKVASATEFWVSAVGGGQVLRSTAVP